MGLRSLLRFFCSMGLRPVLLQRRVGDPRFTHEDGSGDPSYVEQRRVRKFILHTAETGQETRPTRYKNK